MRCRQIKISGIQMSKLDTDTFLNNPDFQRLVKLRGRVSQVFSLIIVIGYGIYILGTAFAPGFMSRPITEGGSLTYGIVIAILVILLGMVTSGIYTWWANTKFDVMKQELLKELGYE